MVSSVRQAVIMVGGKGTRLKPLTDTIPKPILPVLGKPCLSYLIESMVQGGIDHIILACGYRSEQVMDAIGDGSDMGITIEYSYEDTPMGTAGAIKLLEDRLDDVFIAANGDVFADIDIKKEIEEHIQSEACVTISLTPVENPCEFGIARTDEDGRILEFREKPAPEEVFSNLINAGVYVVNKRVMSMVPSGRMYDFSKDLVIELIEKGHRIQGHVIEGIWRDVGRPSDLLDANMIMAEKKGRNDASVERSEMTGAFSADIGSCVCGSKMDGVVLSKNVRVNDSEIRNSMIMEGSEISNSLITNSILGRQCVVSGCEITNMTLADKTIIKKQTITGERI